MLLHIIQYECDKVIPVQVVTLVHDKVEGETLVVLQQQHQQHIHSKQQLIVSNSCGKLVNQVIFCNGDMLGFISILHVIINSTTRGWRVELKKEVLMCASSLSISITKIVLASTMAKLLLDICNISTDIVINFRFDLK